VPLILNPSSHSVDQLREMLRSNREEFRETLAALERPPGEVLHPLSLLTAADLVRGVVALSESVDRPDTDAALLAAMVNVQYDTLQAAIDLLKSHVAMPTVPRRRPK
jgi:hypothetical protein